MLENLKDKRILILGFGREGQDNFLFLRKLFPKKTLGIADRLKIRGHWRKAKNVKFHCGEGYLTALRDYEVIVKSPGVPFKIIAPFLTRKQQLTTQTEIFLKNCPGKIVGVTGTKGKSTTASLVYEVLKKGGIKAHLVGNIGRPALTLLSEVKSQSVFVYELSSHQLYNLKKSPPVAVLLNIYPEHLDYYRSFREYVAAKANITKHQGKEDYLIYNSQDPLVRKIAQQSNAKKILIKGKYYQLNKAAAKKVGEIFKIPSRTISKAIEEFKFLPHRLEFIGKFKGIEFYNDSLSTIPETTSEALDFLGNKVQTLILGGFDRGLSFKKLGQRIAKSKVKTLILFPTTGQRILKEVSSHSIKYFFVSDMKKAVKLTYQHTEKGKICLLSPASPSFGLFKNYEERGNLFKKFVKMLK